MPADPVDVLNFAQLIARFNALTTGWSTSLINLQALIAVLVSGGAVGKATKADLDAVVAPAPGVLGVVYADATAANNGIWVKTGAAGVAGWTATGFLFGSTVPLGVLAPEVVERLPTVAERAAIAHEVPLIGLWRELTLDSADRPVAGVTLNGIRWEARAGVLRPVHGPRLADALEDFAAAALTAESVETDALTVSGPLISEGPVSFDLDTGLPQLVGTVETWVELEVDALMRPVRGVKADGSRWLAIGGVLVRDKPVRLEADGETAIIPRLIVEDALDVPLGSGLTKVIGPGIGDWRELAVDALLRPMWGVKTDGTRWRASMGALIQEGSDPVLKQDWAYAVTTGSAAHKAAQNVDYLVLVNGQSLAVGATSITTDVALTTVPEHSGKALMPSVGVIPAGVNFTAYADLKESTVSPSGSKETVCSGMADAIMRKLNTDLGFKPRMVFAVAGRGGSAYYGSQTDAQAGLKRGSPQYAETLRIAQRCAEISKVAGRTLIVAAVVIVHGEQDHTDGLNKGLYRRALSQWIANLSDDLVAITGQADRVPAYLTQTNRSNGATSEPRISQAQLEVQDHDPALRLVGPIYFGDECGDHSHPAPVTYRHMGQMIGTAVAADRFGPYYEALYVREAWFQTTTTIRARFTGAIAIESDDSKVTISTLGAGKGVSFDDGTGSAPAITGIAVVSGQADTLEVTLASAPTGKRPRLFIATGSSTAWPGRVTGARSGIRSATSFGTDPQDSAVLYHWACQQAVLLQSA